MTREEIEQENKELRAQNQRLSHLKDVAEKRYREVSKQNVELKLLVETLKADEETIRSQDETSSQPIKSYDIAEWCRYIFQWSQRKGFRKQDGSHVAGNEFAQLMLVVTELGEAAEAVRHQDEENFREELADAVIRLFDICYAFDIDLEAEIEKKMKINEQREHMHGKIA